MLLSQRLLSVGDTPRLVATSYATSIQGSGPASEVIQVPTGTKVGDIMILAFMAMSDNDTIFVGSDMPTPSGWTNIDSGGAWHDGNTVQGSGYKFCSRIFQPGDTSWTIECGASVNILHGSIQTWTKTSGLGNFEVSVDDTDGVGIGAYGPTGVTANSSLSAMALFSKGPSPLDVSVDTYPEQTIFKDSGTLLGEFPSMVWHGYENRLSAGDSGSRIWTFSTSVWGVVLLQEILK